MMLLFHVTLTRSLSGVQLVNQVHDSFTHLSGVLAEWPEGCPQLRLSNGAPTGSSSSMLASEESVDKAEAAWPFEMKTTHHHSRRIFLVTK